MQEQRGRLRELGARRWWLGALLGGVAVLLLASAGAALAGEARCAAAGVGAPPEGPVAGAARCNGHACGARLDAVRFAGAGCGAAGAAGGAQRAGSPEGPAAGAGAAGAAGALEYCLVDLRAGAGYAGHAGYAGYAAYAAYAAPAACVPAELARGARAFLLEAHLRRGELRVCRDWCSVRPQRADEVLRVFAEFLRAHPREVLVLWWYPGAARAAERAAVLRELGLAYRRSGLAAFSFRTTEQAWPTFGELVERNQRVVTLVDAGEASGGEGGEVGDAALVFATGAEWDRRVGEGGAGIFAQ
jgi:hypothetical protein